MQVEPNTIYLIPPNAEMVISNGRLLITERDKTETLHLPIDQFFRSLAQECGRKGVGVILSGTGSDGSRGIVAINQAGGLVLCQDEESAKFDGMPTNAQKTNMVHLVLPPERMAEVLSTYIERAMTPESLTEHELVLNQDSGVGGIFKLLRREHRIDFSVYKPTTVMRRIERRIALGGYAHIDEYLQILLESPEELSVLYHDLLIGVTQFFRDPPAFQFLQTEIIPEIIEKKRNSSGPIRIWSAGCASGEEAYSMAIAFQEGMKHLAHPPLVKIFATDVHRRSLHFASQGLYPAEAFDSMPGEIQSRYFNKRADGFEISPEIRKLIVFAPHDVINDAPFTKLDLISCRNMLIYFQPIVQKKVISLFHFGLQTGAYMFLGPSETPGEWGEEFDVLNKKWRFYKKRRDVRLPANIRLPTYGSQLPKSLLKSGEGRSTPESQMLSTYDSLLDRCMPPSFLVDEGGHLIHSFGGAQRFLQFRGGRVSTSILDIIHEDLKTSVSGALQHAAKERKEIRYTGIAVKTSIGLEQVRLVVDPIRDPRTEIVHTLISIEPLENAPEVASSLAKDVNVSELAQNHISALENELRYTKENLQATVEELETSNEELQATNEELVASNEEMHSTNEELQSVNEELYTVNHEYQLKINELTEVTDDMNNLFQLTEVGVIFLDRDLKIRRFTPKIADMFNLLPQDVGRSIDNFTHNLSDETVLDKLKSVLETAEPLSEEVIDREGHHWLLRIIPYQTKLEVGGVVATLVDINSVKETDASLRRYRDIVESTVEAIIGANPKGIIHSWNPGAEALYGYTADEIIGQHVTKIMPEELKSEAAEFTQRIFAGESIKNHFTTRVRKDGELLYVAVTVSAVYDAAGKIIGISSLSHDLTDQRKAELEQEQLNALIKSTSDLVGVCDPTGTTLSINPAGRRMLGVTEDKDVVGANISNWYSDDQAKIVLEKYMPVALKQGEWRGTTSILNRETGEQIALSAVLTAHKDQNDEIAFFSMVGRDVTKQIEFDSQQRVFRYAFQSSLTAMVISDATKPDNPITYVNPGFEKLTGYPSSEVVGKNCRFLQGPGTDPKSIEKIRTAVSKGEAVRTGLLNYRKDGQPFYNELVITPVKNEQGKVVNFVGVQLDMTQQQEAEQKMVQARDVAEAANSAKSSFVANMSHEIRTPLTTIVGMTEMLLDHESDKSKHDTLQLIHQSSRHLATLVNDVLDLSKIEAGKLEADMSEVAPMQIIEDVGASMSYRAKEKGLTFEIEYEGMIPEFIETDPVRFRQILFNLAGNAVKFTEEGGVTLRCKLIKPGKNATLQIEFDDTGIGFEESEIEKLFEKFTQVDASATRRRGGSGLGLFISRRIVELLGGELTARKKKNAGSVFAFTLPVVDSQQRTMIDPATLLAKTDGLEKKTDTRDFDLGGRRILVAEDTRGIQLLIQRILKNAGAEVDVVDDGQAVIEKLAANKAENKQPYDLLLLDMHMPRMSGYEAAAEIRKTWQSTPIIALTASALKGDREKCLKYGCNDYLTKPIERTKLLTVIASQLAK